MVLEGIEPGQASSDPSALAHRYVREGILAEQKRWSHPHDTEFDVLLPADHHTCGDPSTIVAHGAGLAVLREQVYRQLWPSPTDLVEGLSGFQTPYDVRKGVVMADHHVLGL